MELGVIINLGLGAVIAIAAIVGLCVGFCRQFSRPLVGLGAILVAIILVELFYPMVFNTGFLDKYLEKATGLFTAEYYTRPITDLESFQSAISDSYLRIFSGSAETVYGWMEKTLEGADTMTIGSFFGRAIVDITIGLAMWIIIYLIIKYFLIGIKFLLEKISNVIVFKSIDRILGLVWALIWTYLIAVSLILTAGELVISQFFPDFAPTVAGYIEQSTLLKLAHDTNVIGSFISNLLNVPLITVGAAA